MRHNLALLVAVAMAGVSRAGAQNIVLHPYVWKDVPGSTFTASVSPTAVMMSDENVVAASGYANRHDWRVSTDGVTDRTFGPADYFDISADVTLTGTPISPRKEAGLRINSPCGDSLLMVNTDAHEVVAFGGAFPTYDFRAHGAPNYNSGDTIHLRVQYLQQSGVNGFVLTAGTVVSPFLPAANAGKAVCAGSTLGGYLQVQRAATSPNSGSTVYTGIAFSSGTVAPPVITDEVLLDRTEAQACLYASSQLVTTPAVPGFPNGRAMLVDSTVSGNVCSNAATGFGLVCLAIEARRYGTSAEWTVTPAEARAKANAILDTILELQAGVQQWSGIPYHWTHPDATGAFVRDGTSEVSTTDGAYMVAGALAAGQAFGAEVRTKALQIAANVHWSAYLINSNGVPRISMAWQPASGNGYSIPAGNGFLTTGTWDRVTDEILTITTLAMGNEPHNTGLLSALYSWPRTKRSYVGGNGTTYSLVPSYFGSMFTYTQIHGLLPLYLLGADHPTDTGASVPALDWWANAVTAAQASRQFSADHALGQAPADGYATHAAFGPNSWGLTAAANPSAPYDYKGLLGALPREANGGAPEPEGIIAPYGALTAMPLMRTSPTEAPADNASFAALRHYYNTQFSTLWGPYGPQEAFDDSGAVANLYIGIDAPLEGINIEAYRSGVTYGWFASSPPVADGIAVIFHKGLAPGDLDLDGAVTVADAATALKIASGLGSASPAQGYNGDLNGDGRVTLEDAVAIAVKAVKG
ncbi:MAG TPA: glucoamylase family protein [Armatimonadota bacterium]|jgi:hypothetical protein